MIRLLSSAVAQARFEDGVRQGKNYAAARMRIRGAENAEDVIEVAHSLGKNQHAELYIINFLLIFSQSMRYCKIASTVK